MKLKLHQDLFFLFTILMIIVTANAINQVPASAAAKASTPGQNRFTSYMKEIVKGLKGPKDLSETQLKECLPMPWYKDTDEDIAIKANDLLSQFIGKFDKFYPTLDIKLEKPCEKKALVKQALIKDPPLISFLEISSKTKLLRSSTKTHGKSKNKMKRFAPITNVFRDHAFVINTSLNDLFKSEFFTLTRVTLQCFQTRKDATPEFKNFVTNFLTNINTFQTGKEGFINAAVDAVCNWIDLKLTLLTLGKAKIEKDKVKKWVQYGQFIVNLAKAFGTKV
jgi:hypothetical protein